MPGSWVVSQPGRVIRPHASISASRAVEEIVSHDIAHRGEEDMVLQWLSSVQRPHNDPSLPLIGWYQDDPFPWGGVGGRTGRASED